MVLVYCENVLICDELGEEVKCEGCVMVYDYVVLCLVFIEVEVICCVLYLVKVVGCCLYVCYISSLEGVEEVMCVCQEGQDVICELCLYYFVFDIDQFEEIGILVKCFLLICDQENQKGMWEKLFNGEIDCLVFDYFLCFLEMKVGNIM